MSKKHWHTIKAPGEPEPEPLPSPEPPEVYQILHTTLAEFAKFLGIPVDPPETFFERCRAVYTSLDQRVNGVETSMRQLKEYQEELRRFQAPKPSPYQPSANPKQDYDDARRLIEAQKIQEWSQRQR